MTKPIGHVEVVRTPVELKELTLEWVLLNMAENTLQVKVQPINKELTIRGDAFEAMKPGLEKALEKVLAPVIDAALNPKKDAETGRPGDAEKTTDQ